MGLGKSKVRSFSAVTEQQHVLSHTEVCDRTCCWKCDVHLPPRYDLMK